MLLRGGSMLLAKILVSILCVLMSVAYYGAAVKVERFSDKVLFAVSSIVCLCMVLFMIYFK